MNSEITSQTAQVVIAVVPIVGIAIGGVILFFYLLWTHHETKLRIRTGAYKAPEFDLKTFSLLAGLLLTGIGIILSLLFALIDGFHTLCLAACFRLPSESACSYSIKSIPTFTTKNEQTAYLGQGARGGIQKGL